MHPEIEARRGQGVRIAVVVDASGPDPNDLRPIFLPEEEEERIVQECDPATYEASRIDTLQVGYEQLGVLLGESCRADDIEETRAAAAEELDYLAEEEFIRSKWLDEAIRVEDVIGAGIRRHHRDLIRHIHAIVTSHYAALGLVLPPASWEE